MGSYTYEAINNAGDFVAGKIEAEQESLAFEQLRRDGFAVVEIKEERISYIYRWVKMGLLIKYFYNTHSTLHYRHISPNN